MKKCRKCFIEYLINSFPKGRAQCSSCRKKANAEWRENNKRYIKKKNKEKWIKFKSNPENLNKRKEAIWPLILTCEKTTWYLPHIFIDRL